MRTAFIVVLALIFALLAPDGVCAPPVPAHDPGDDSSALINEALDKVVSLEVDGVLPQVMKKITDQTAVPIEVPQRVYDLLPWGEQTNIRATIKGQTLRQALTAITHKLGLSWEVGPQAVQVQPRPALQRLGRRATLQELQALDILGATALGESPPPGKPTTVQWVVNTVDQRLKEVAPSYSVEFRPGEKIKPEQPLSLPRNATLGDALKEISRQTDATWYPWGQNIVVVPKEDQITRQLDRTVSKRFSNAELAQVLTELSAAAGVEFSLEPGALQRVPPEFRKVTLLLDNAKIRQALEDIRGVTGLDYLVKPSGVYLWNQNPPAATTLPAAPGGPILAELQLDNGMQLFLRHDDIPADILDYAEHKKLQEFKRLRQQMKDEQFTPSTQPATRPAAE